MPHSRIKECLELFGVANTIKTLLVNSMEKWRVMLFAGNSELGVDIKPDIFSGRFFISFSVCFSIGPIDSQKGQGSILVFRKQRILIIFYLRFI